MLTAFPFSLHMLSALFCTLYMSTALYYTFYMLSALFYTLYYTCYLPCFTPFTYHMPCFTHFTWYLPCLIRTRTPTLFIYLLHPILFAAYAFSSILSVDIRTYRCIPFAPVHLPRPENKTEMALEEKSSKSYEKMLIVPGETQN